MLHARTSGPITFARFSCICYPIIRSTGKWYTSLEQPHDEIHLAIGGQDHQPIRAMKTETYDENGDVLTTETKVSPQVSRGRDHNMNGDMLTSGNAECQSVAQNHL